MLIVGAKDFAKEVLEIFSQQDESSDGTFFDHVNTYIQNVIYIQFLVIKSVAVVEEYFKVDPRFVLGVGAPSVRQLLTTRTQQVGGHLTSNISPKAIIGSFQNSIGAGANIMSGAVLANDVKVGKEVLINLHCTIGHDVVIGDYCESLPGVHLSGNVKLGANVVLGTGAVVLPELEIGENSIIGAGSVVNKNIPVNVVAVGIPAKIISDVK